MPIIGGREQTPIPIHEKILQPDGKPTKEFVRYLLDAKQEGTEGTGGKVPLGTIIMYYGLVIAIPTGWSICNGENDTPNLVDQFILGTATEEEIGNTGGYAAPQMPAHVHTQTSHTHTIAHTHSIAHTHTIGTHVHSQTSHTHSIGTHTHTMSHTHTLAHTHTIDQHTHTINHDHGSATSGDNSVDHVHAGLGPVPQWYQGDIVPGSGWTIISEETPPHTGNNSEPHTHNTTIPYFSGGSGNTSLTTNAASTPNTGSASTSSTGADSTPNTGGATSANTGAASTPNTGGTSTANTGAASTPNTGGATSANTGSTGAGDEVRGNYPPYAILMFLMRTR